VYQQERENRQISDEATPEIVSKRHTLEGYQIHLAFSGTERRDNSPAGRLSSIAAASRLYLNFPQAQVLFRIQN
jgi:hypothetical protein